MTEAVKVVTFENYERGRMMENGFLPSTHQDDVFAHSVGEDSHAIVTAVAGGGKSSSLVEDARRLQLEWWDVMKERLGIDRDLQALFVAFTKVIQLELAPQVKQYGWDCRTCHGFGFEKLLRSGHFGGDCVHDGKIWDLLEYDILECPVRSNGQRRDFRDRKLGPKYRFLYDFAKKIKDLVGMLKGGMVGFQADGTVDAGAIIPAAQEVAALKTIEIPSSPREQSAFWTRLCQVYIKSLDFDQAVERQEIDYDDMVAYPLLHQDRLGPQTLNDVVLIDEVQDLSMAQIEMAVRSIHPDHGRIIAVGDPNQAIFTFRLMEDESMSVVRRRLEATSKGVRDLKLSVCYRCKPVIIDEAIRVCAIYGLDLDIQPAPNATGGIVGEVKEEDITTVVRPGDALLCALNGPTVAMAFRLLGQNIACKVKGKDIGDSIIGFIRELVKGRFQLPTWELGGLVEGYMTRKRRALERKGNPDEAQAQLEALQDKCHVVDLFCDKYDTVQQVLDAIKQLFLPDQDTGLWSGVILSTIHKAKGLEWDRVFALEPFPPLTWAKGQSAKKAWVRALYVLITRAKNEFYWVLNTKKSQGRP